MAKDYEAEGGMACYASRHREECPYRKPEHRDAWLRGWDDANRTRRLRAEQSVRAQIREVEARVARTLAAVERDRELIATLTADADRMALEHERPHGIRGLADRFARRGFKTGDSWVLYDDMRECHGVRVYGGDLTDDDLNDVLGWVHREMAREVERRANACYVAHRRCSTVVCMRDVNERPPCDACGDDGLESNDREALTDHIGGLLGGAFSKGDGKATAVAWALCDAAGRP